MSRNFSMNIIAPTLLNEDFQYFRKLWVEYDLRAVQIMNNPEMAYILYTDKMNAGQTDFKIVYRNYPDEEIHHIQEKGGMSAVLSSMKANIDQYNIPHEYIVYQPVNEWGTTVMHWVYLHNAVRWAEENECTVGTGAWGTGGWDMDNMSEEERSACIGFYDYAVTAGCVIDTCHEYAAQRDVHYKGMYRGEEVNYDPADGQLWQIGRFIHRQLQMEYYHPDDGIEHLPTMVLEAFYDDIQDSAMKGYDVDLYDSSSTRVPAAKMIEDLTFIMDYVYDPKEDSPYYHQVRNWNPNGVPVLWFSFGNGGMGQYNDGDWRQFNLAADWGARHSRPRYQEFFDLLEVWYSNREESELNIPVLEEKDRKLIRVRPVNDYMNVRQTPTTTTSNIVGKFQGEWEVPYYNAPAFNDGYTWYYFDLSVIGLTPGWMASDYLVMEEITDDPPSDIDSAIIALTQVQNELANLQIIMSENSGKLANLYEKIGTIIEGLG